MSHFGSGDWNNPCGLVFQYSALAFAAVNGATAVAVANSSYTCVRTGLYRISAALRVATADAGSSAAETFIVNYTDEAAQARTATIATALLVTQHTLSATAPIVIRAGVGTVISLTHTNAGTINAGKTSVDVTYEAL